MTSFLTDATDDRMQEPTDRMCLMARLVEGAGPLAGGALASRLHGHSQHGDPAVSSLVQRMMNSVCAPLYVSKHVFWVVF